MEGLKGHVKEVTSSNQKAILVQGRWLPDPQAQPVTAVTDLYDKEGWLIENEQHYQAKDHGWSTFTSREYGLFQHYPVAKVFNNGLLKGHRLNIDIAWQDDTTYRLYYTLANEQKITDRLYRLITLDDKCRQAASATYIYTATDTMLMSTQKTIYKGDTIINELYISQDRNPSRTSYSTPLERDSNGNVTRLLSRIEDHYELTIYNYTYY